MQVDSPASRVSQPTLAPPRPISLSHSPFLSTVTSPFRCLTVFHGSRSVSAPLVARLYNLSSPRSRFHSRMTRCCWCSGTRSLARRRLAPFIMIIIVLRDSHHGQTINRPNDDHHNNNDIRIALTFTILLVLSIRNDMINIGASTKTKLEEFKYSHRYFYVIVDDRKRN